MVAFGFTVVGIVVVVCVMVVGIVVDALKRDNGRPLNKVEPINTSESGCNNVSF